LLNESNETKFSQWKTDYKAEREEELNQFAQRLGEETSSRTSELFKSHLEQEKLKNQMAKELDKVN
jgi:hypothetical protein